MLSQRACPLDEQVSLRLSGGPLLGLPDVLSPKLLQLLLRLLQQLPELPAAIRMPPSLLRLYVLKDGHPFSVLPPVGVRKKCFRPT